MTRRLTTALLTLVLLAAGCGVTDEPAQVTTSETASGNPDGTGSAEATEAQSPGEESGESEEGVSLAEHLAFVEPLDQVQAAEELAASRQRWQDAAIADYTMVFRLICACPDTSVIVEVQAGEARSTTIIGSDADDEAEHETVEDLFNLVDEAIANGADGIGVSYDDETGRPVVIKIDQGGQVTGMEVTRFEIAGDQRDDSAPPVEAIKACPLFTELFELEDSPDTPGETEAMLDDMVEISQQLENEVPEDMKDEAAFFAGWVTDLRTASEQADFDPEPFQNDDPESIVALSDEELDMVQAYLMDAGELCGQS